MWKVAALIVLTLGMITLASACGGEKQQEGLTPTATIAPTEGPTRSPTAAATGEAGTGSDSSPAWSPDGSRIAFRSIFPDGNSEIYVMNADGSGRTRLTNNPTLDSSPPWSS